MQITPAAAAKIKADISAMEGAENLKLRILPGGIGCGGINLKLMLDDVSGKEDLCEESNGISVVFDKKLELILKNAVIDYDQSAFRPSLRIKGPGISVC